MIKVNSLLEKNYFYSNCKIFFLQSNLHWICVQKVLIISKHYHDQDNEGLLTLLTFYNWNKNETIFYISRKTVNKAKSGWKLAT